MLPGDKLKDPNTIRRENQELLDRKKKLCEGAVCRQCGDDTPCPYCSFFDAEDNFYPTCHDCGRDFEENN